jgi:hypothetical protein
MQEGRGGTYRKKIETHAGRRFRDIQEGNRGTCRKEMEGRKWRSMQEGNGGRKNTPEGNLGACRKEIKQHAGRKWRNMQKRKKRGSWKDSERRGHALSVIPSLPYVLWSVYCT